MGPEPAAGLAAADQLAEPLGRYVLFHSTRADLLRRLERYPEARAAYRRAIELCGNSAEKVLTGRLTAISE